MSKDGPEKFFSKYDLHETLGHGAFSEVKIGVCKETGLRYAVKIVDRSKCKGKEDMVETEVHILKMIRHENIVQLYEMYEFDGKIYLVMELVTGGELFDEIMGRGTFGEKDAAGIVQKILKAVQYLHDKGIVHRDLKPENLLLSDKSNNPEIKISDFGLSKIFKDAEVMKTACGTPGYVAPEVLKKKGYGPQVDLWSLGVITYILLCGYPPFFDSSNPELFKKIMAGRFQFDRPWWDNISDQAKDFVCKLLIVEPSQRWTATQALLHPFIINNCSPVQAQLNTLSAAAAGIAQSPKAHPPKFTFNHPASPVAKAVPIPTFQKNFNRPAAGTPSSRPPSSSNPITRENHNIPSSHNPQNFARPGETSTQSPKNQFSRKVNRISSWFRTATIAEKRSAQGPIPQDD